MIACVKVVFGKGGSKKNAEQRQLVFTNSMHSNVLHAHRLRIAESQPHAGVLTVCTLESYGTVCIHSAPASYTYTLGRRFTLCGVHQTVSVKDSRIGNPPVEPALLWWSSLAPHHESQADSGNHTDSSLYRLGGAAVLIGSCLSPDKSQSPPEHAQKELRYAQEAGMDTYRGHWLCVAMTCPKKLFQIWLEILEGFRSRLGCSAAIIMPRQDMSRKMMMMNSIVCTSAYPWLVERADVFAGNTLPPFSPWRCSPPPASHCFRCHRQSMMRHDAPSHTYCNRQG